MDQKDQLVTSHLDQLVISSLSVQTPIHSIDHSSDHLPLKTLFQEHTNIPVHASGRIQQWTMLLASYEYTIAYRPTQKYGNADAMS